MRRGVRFVILLFVTLQVISRVSMDITDEDKSSSRVPDDRLKILLEFEHYPQNSTEADYYRIYTGDSNNRHKRAVRRRPGSCTDTHSCNQIRSVPRSLRSAGNIGPSGLSYFYQKYTEAYGIPVLGSRVVSDEALKRACYVLRFLLADNSAVRQSYYKMSGRVAIMAVTEYTTSIPEHAWLGSWWNDRARGLGATEHAPVSSGGEENVRCDKYGDRYQSEDIFLHELSHGIHLLGAKYAVPGWDRRLRYLYSVAKSRGLWRNTYSMSSPEEYFAEGVQSFFGVNAYSRVADGIHGPISTRSALQQYDRELYDLIVQVFPCENKYIKRCNKDREGELNQVLIMSCDRGRPETTSRKTSPSTSRHPSPTTIETNATSVTTTSKPIVVTKKITIKPKECVDQDGYCPFWAMNGECGRNPAYMLRFCRKSCKQCETKRECFDDDISCDYWAKHGECLENPNYMLIHCKKSCNSC